MKDIKKYRKKPIVVEAMQYNVDVNTLNALTEFMGSTEIRTYDHGIIKLVIKTLEGEIFASPNDYIIKGINGEFYPCKEDIFLKTYEEAEE